MTDTRKFEHYNAGVRTMSIKPIIAWYDLWIGFYWNREKRRLYVLPLPCIGVVIQFQEKG
jgi:hypothetical protein